MTSKGEIFCNLQLFSRFSSDQWRRKIPLCGSSNISPKFPDEKVTDCDHLDLLHSAKTCAILLLHPREEINFSWTGYWSKNNLRSKLVFEVVQSSPYRPARRHNQAKVLLRVFWVRKRILDTLGSTLSGTQVWVSSLCGASLFHRLRVPDCRRSAWPNQQTTNVHISWYIKWLFDYFIISTVGALTVTTV